MRDLGFEVRLEPVMVRHWVREKEEAQLVRYPGQVGHSSQKIALAALGNTTATPPEGFSAPVLVVKSFDQLEQVPLDRR